MRKPTHRLIAILILALWMAPTAGALGVGLHLALDHHDHHGAEHSRDLSDLVRTAAHGHHHDAQAALDHEHQAKVERFAPLLKPNPSLAVVIPSLGHTHTAVQRSRPDRFPRRGPPAPLFTAHCSLLL